MSDGATLQTSWCTPQEFRGICELLWGRRFITDASRDLNISQSKVARYLRGETPVPDGLRHLLRDFLVSKESLIYSKFELLDGGGDGSRGPDEVV